MQDMLADDTRHVAKTNPWPMQFPVARAEGSYIYDQQGEAYLDMLSGICVNNFGHKHPQILTAYKEQLQKYSFTMVYGEHVQAPQVSWSKLMMEQMPYFDKAYFLTTGTETIEAACKLAKRATGRSELISMSRSYHGSTQGSLSLMDDQAFTGRYRPLLPAVRHIRFGDVDDLDRITSATAAVVSEVYQSATGITIPEADYHRALRARCDQVGSLLIYDEIQTGFGRCGELMAHMQVGVEPDLLCLAKAMGGGLPVSALLGCAELLDQLTHDPVFGHISSMGGHPVCMAGAVAALRLLVETDLMEASRARAEQFAVGLDQSRLSGFRQKGLYMALELETAEQLNHVMEELYNQKVLAGRFFFNDRAFRLTPPLTISEAEMDLAIERVNGVISDF